MDKEPEAQVRRWRAFAVLAVSFFMTIIDLTIVNVALPTIGRDLHFSEANLQWVVTAYGSPSAGSCCSGGVPQTCSGGGGSSWPAWPCSRPRRWAPGWPPPAAS